MREREESSDVILLLFLYVGGDLKNILFLFWNVDRDTQHPDLNR
jgi:hypothetical protein